jgi:hypothetical protein
MIPKRYQDKVRVAAVTGTIFTLVLIILLLGLAQPVPIIQADLPSLNTPTPTAAGADDSGDDDDTPLIAHIELQVQSAPAGSWSVVQWQDSDGNWHDVEGWRSLLPENGVQRWAVEAKDFYTGPFRWVVRPGQSGPATGMSDSFNLPSGANETVQVTIALP